LLGRHFKPLLTGRIFPPSGSKTCDTAVLRFSSWQATPKYVRDLLGHASMSITLDTYSQVVEGMDGGLGDAMDEALCAP
jgi:integrase